MLRSFLINLALAAATLASVAVTYAAWRFCLLVDALRVYYLGE